MSRQRRNEPVPITLTLPKLLNIKEVAHIFNVSTRTVHTLKESRQLTYFRIRGQIRFDRNHIEEYLRRRMVQAA